MLNKVHHITFVVESIEDMAAYIERNFSMSPISTDEFEDRGFKSILYQIGGTYVDFFEPLRDDTPITAFPHQGGRDRSKLVATLPPRPSNAGAFHV